MPSESPSRGSTRTADRGQPPNEQSPDYPIAALRAGPDRTVFTEDGNVDGWIATDLTVELRE